MKINSFSKLTTVLVILIVFAYFERQYVIKPYGQVCLNKSEQCKNNCVDFSREELLNLAILHNPSLDQAYFKLAEEMKRLGRMDESLSVLHKAFLLNAFNENVLNEVYDYYLNENQPEIALRYLRQYSNIMHPHMHFKLGRIHEELDYYFDAIEYYKKSMRSEKDINEKMIRLGYVYYKVGDLHKEMEMISQLSRSGNYSTAVDLINLIKEDGLKNAPGVSL